MEITELIAITKSIEKEVCLERDGLILRRYYRFRSSRHYGGSAVADVVGCNLSCVYCWSWRVNARPWLGSLETPQSVVEKLLGIARHNNHRVVRLSGGEPTLCFDHLLQVLGLFSSARYLDELFVLETNGILLGLFEDLVARLKIYRDFLLVRVSLKGCTENDFKDITGIGGDVYGYQIRALENLRDNGIAYGIAIPISFCTKQSFSKLLEALTERIGEKVVEVIEPETLVVYPSIIERLCRKNLRPWIAVDATERKKIKGAEVDEFFRRRCREYG